MAKYTETLYDYIEGGGTLPSSFSQIENLDRYFIQRYAGSEIGFEIEELFKNALELKADLVIPNYKKRIDAYDSAFSRVLENSRKHTETRTYGAVEQKTTTMGSATELPFDKATALPSGTTEGSGESTTKERTDTATIQDFASVGENLQIMNEMTEKRAVVLENLLDEFKDLFMGVY